MFGEQFNPKESFLKQELAVSGITNNLDPVTGKILFDGLVAGGQYLMGQSAQSSANAAGRAAKRLDRKQKKTDWRYQNQLIQNQNEYNKKSVEIARKNQDLEIARLEQQAMDNWSYNMTIRDFDFSNQMQAYGLQKANEQLQLGFNEAAFQFANQQQDNFVAEQKLAFDFADLKIDTDWANGFMDYELKQKGLDIEQQAARASNSFSMEKAQIEGLKKEGLARSKGQAGRTAAKNIQAAIAESGLVQAEIAESTFQAGRQYQNSSAINAQNLEKLSDDLEIEQRKIAAGRISLANADKIARKGFKLDKLQSDMNARAKVMMKPKLAPDLPPPPDLDLYKAEIQDAFILEELPEPAYWKEGDSTGTVDPTLAGLSAAAPAVTDVVGGIAKQFSKPKIN